MPAVTIEDRPRFGWRGAHLDAGRHFMPKEFVKKYIDLLALHKMNMFHWHLTEDQGWRIEIKKYPRLTEVGAWRAETLVGRPAEDPAENRYDGVRHGGFYTQDEVREVVAYATRPLHHRRAGDRDAGPRRRAPSPPTRSSASHAAGHPTVLTLLGRDPTTSSAPSDATFAFLQDVLTEVLDALPWPVHPHRRRRGAEGTVEGQPRGARRGSRSGAEGRGRAAELVHPARSTRSSTAKGRRLIGWDEILEGGLAPGAAVMSWRGVKGGIAAAAAGHDVVMAPTSTYLLRLLPGQGPDGRAAGHRRLPAAREGLHLRAGSRRAQSRGREACARRPGAALDRVHVHPETRRVHGVSAAVGAGRGGLDSGCGEGLRGLLGAPRHAPAAPGGARRERPAADTLGRVVRATSRCRPLPFTSAGALRAATPGRTNPSPRAPSGNRHLRRATR